jgi:hypothetical protein
VLPTLKNHLITTTSYSGIVRKYPLQWIFQG